MKHRQINLMPIVFLLAFLFGAGVPELFAQYDRERDATIPLEHFYIKRQRAGLRHLLSKLHWSVSSGYAVAPFRHDLSGTLGIVQDPGAAPQLFRGDTSARYSGWVTDLIPAASPALGGFIARADTTDLGFRSRGFSIPLKATVHVEFSRYRIGGGYSFDYTRVGEFAPLAYQDQIGNFTVEKPGFFMKHYFGMIGATVYRYYEYALVVDANVGGYKLGRQFNKRLIQRSLYFNIGVTAERDISQHFRVFIRPSYERKNYTLGIPESGEQITYRLNAFYVNAGITYRLHELRRCFLKSCHAQINHAHGNREYRSRRHPFYKNQNPHYGENYPTLIKYKGKNKNKLNPY